MSTARSMHSQQRLQQEIDEASRVLSGGIKNINRSTQRNVSFKSMSSGQPFLNFGTHYHFWASYTCFQSLHISILPFKLLPAIACILLYMCAI